VIGQAVKLVGKRAQRLGQQAQLAAAYRELAPMGLEQGTARRDDIADVPVAKGLMRLGARVLVADEELDTTGAVLDGGKAGFAHQALEHQAASHCDLDRCLLQLLARGIVVRGVQRRRQVGAIEIVRIRRAMGAHCGELAATLSNDLIIIRHGGGRGRYNLGHGAPIVRRRSIAAPRRGLKRLA